MAFEEPAGSSPFLAVESSRSAVPGPDTAASGVMSVALLDDSWLTDSVEVAGDVGS